MPNSFRAGWTLGNKIIRPGIEYTCGMLWGIICPMPDDVQVVPIKGDLGLEDGAKAVLSDALANKEKKFFFSMLYEYKERFDLYPVKVAQSITLCLEAMKRGAPETNACLNLLGASILKQSYTVSGITRFLAPNDLRKSMNRSTNWCMESLPFFDQNFDSNHITFSIELQNSKSYESIFSPGRYDSNTSEY